MIRLLLPPGPSLVPAVQILVGRRHTLRRFTFTA